MVDKHQELEKYLSGIELVLGNARHHPVIFSALSNAGYDDATLKEGAELASVAWERHKAYLGACEEDVALNEMLLDAWQQADERYKRHRQFARVALRDDLERLHTLRLHERHKSTFPAWASQARHFYVNALDDGAVLDALFRFQVTQDSLSQGQALVQRAQALYRRYVQECVRDGKVLDARDAAIEALDDWFDDFDAAVRLALEDNAQLLEALQLGTIP